MKARFGALMVIVFLGYGLSAYPQGQSNDNLDRLRKQFQYGRSLVLICRQTVHEVVRTLDCENDALFPSKNTRVPQPVSLGADYQMMVMEQEAGQFSFHADLVRGQIDTLFKGDPELYCNVWNVDCGPVHSAIDDWEKRKKLSDAAASDLGPVSRASACTDHVNRLWARMRPCTTDECRSLDLHRFDVCGALQ